MNTLITIVIVALCLIVLGGIVMFCYMAGQAGGAVMGWVMNASEDANDRSEAASQEISPALRKAQAEADYWQAFARKHER